LRFGRYVLRERLGQGGMGVVWRADDVELNRAVAIKFVAPLLAGDEAARARFTREARAAAALDHPGIGAVYEVGEHRGQQYLVMPYYEGETLKQRLEREPLSRDEAVSVLIELADALGAAHAAGLVHRDVKPGNVMLTAGGLKMLDFGLAKWVAADDSLTTTGELIGTIAYMAPEQLKRGPVDQRADVWALGVVGVELTAGTRPFAGASSMEVANAVLTNEPRLERALPRDLEAILLACLDKQPGLRYADAAALAADLRRFAAGEPVRARHVGRARRLLARARKHRVAVAAVGAALSAIVAVSAYAIVARVRAGEAARRGRELALEAQRVRAIMSNANLLPLHDTRRERAEVRARMQRIEVELEHAGGERGTAWFALGAGHVALGELERARPLLERAWQAGERSADEAYTLGWVLAERYHADVEDARLIADPARRRKREAELEHDRDVARNYLRMGSAAPDADPDATEALIALTEWRYDDSIRLAESALARHPQRYEVGRIAATATLWRESMVLAQAKTDQLTALREALWKRLESIYGRLTEIGRSDSTLYRAEATDLYHVAIDLQSDAHYAAAIAAAERGLVADPDDSRLHEIRARALRDRAETATDKGVDPRPVLADARAAAERALALDPEQRGGQARAALGAAWMSAAIYELNHGVDPRPSLEQAERALDAATRTRPDEEVYTWLGIVAGVHAAYDAARGIDGDPWWQRARVALERSIAIYDGSPTPFHNLGSIANDRAAWVLRHGGDPRPDLDRAQRQFERAQEIIPSAYSLANRVLTFTLRARYERAEGGDARAWLERAFAVGAQALTVDRANAECHGYLARAHALAAQLDLDAGRDPAKEVAATLASARQALAADANEANAVLATSEAELVAARVELRAGRDPSAALRNAARAAARLHVVDATIADAALAAAAERRIDAEARIARHVSGRT
jgi:serine/threonine-protein kinase